MRVLYCSESYCPHDHRFLSAITATGKHEVYWYRLEGEDRIQEEREIPTAVHVIERPQASKIKWLDYFRLKREFAFIVNSVKPDVIHAGPIQRVAFLAALNDFHPLISMSWGFDMLQDAHRNFFWKAITRFVLKRTDWLIADCQTVRKMATRFGYASANVSIFPWGVDRNLFSPQYRRESRDEIGFQEDLLIVHTRSWEPRYGVDIALAGLKQAIEAQPQIQVLMLGGGSQEKAIKAFIKNYDLTDHFHFLGYQSNEKLVDYYRAADVYLSASHVDGSSVALLEAMSCGCVPVVSDIPSNMEWVTDGMNGWSFRDKSAHDLAQTLLKVLAEKDQLSDYRKKSLQRIAENADWEKGKRKLLNTYEMAANCK